MGFFSRLRELRQPESQTLAIDQDIADLLRTSAISTNNGALHIHHCRDELQNRVLTPSSKANPPLRSVLRREKELSCERRTVTFADDRYKSQPQLRRTRTSRAWNVADIDATPPFFAIDQGKSTENSNRNGMVHLQRKAKVPDLRAVADLFPTSSMIQLHRKSGSHNLRATAQYQSEETQQPPNLVHPNVEIDITIQTLAITSPIRALQHCRTCSCSVHSDRVVCDVCKESFVPGGLERLAGNFCAGCVGKAFEEIVAEDEQCETDEKSSESD